MVEMLRDAVTGPAAWTGATLAGSDDWIHELSAPQLTELDAALAAVKARDLRFPHFTREDFPLPGTAADLQHHAQELETGRGFVLLRGLPVARYSDDDIRILLYGLGLNMGSPVRQNPAGDLLGEVMNVGDPADPQTRVYQTNAYLPYHTDPSDVVGLLCLRRARSGGLSALVSAAAVYNALLQQAPESLAVLYRPFYYAHMGDELPGLSPVFSYHAGRLACRYLRQYIELGHEVMGVALSPRERDALDAFDRATQAPEMRLDMMLEPGDLQFVNNYAVLHSRTGFEDHDDLSARRRMLRLWLKMDNARPLADHFPGRNGFGEVGSG